MLRTVFTKRESASVEHELVGETTRNGQHWALIFASAAFVLIGLLLKKQRKRRIWVSDFLKKSTTRNAAVLLDELSSQPEHGSYQHFCRINADDFEHLLTLIEDKIKKDDINCREAIPPRQKLAVTPRYVATGHSHASLMFLSRISKTAISKIIPELCQALMSSLREYIKIPQTHEELLSISGEFLNKWGFPHCLWALDVMMSIADAKHNFIYVDVGSQGRISDGFFVLLHQK
ncbi:hypothetical protein PR048_003065 [Dryococelus australis]|uniref:Uncharacterized protein n=1 Tax=Dryococelus australis TaxID=614101 RepID=A0ABQ9ING8_9NEOP|nr:hypothetical protein PR048_003065 [Dryococelus australis]